MPARIRLTRTALTVMKITPLDRLSVTEQNFNYVPTDGDFGANRTLRGFLALGDITLQIRPARVQETTLPALPVLAPFPSWTTLSTRTGDPGTVTLMPADLCITAL